MTNRTSSPSTNGRARRTKLEQKSRPRKRMPSEAERQPQMERLILWWTSTLSTLDAIGNSVAQLRSAASAQGTLAHAMFRGRDLAWLEQEMNNVYCAMASATPAPPPNPIAAAPDIAGIPCRPAERR